MSRPDGAGAEGGARRARGFGQLAAGSATVRLAAGAVVPSALIGAVERVGYEARIADGGSEERAERQAARGREADSLRRRVLVAGSLTLPIVVILAGLEMGLPAAGRPRLAAVFLTWP